MLCEYGPSPCLFRSQHRNTSQIILFKKKKKNQARTRQISTVRYTYLEKRKQFHESSHWGCIDLVSGILYFKSIVKNSLFLMVDQCALAAMCFTVPSPA